ncbi:hypothetical protein J4437_07310 [Candidatus Woesearchaeota archaeon]|nr:hypothetical protein [Candidatus Woesearchaeota archaeon]
MKCIFCESMRGIDLNSKSNHKNRSGICINCLDGLNKVNYEVKTNRQKIREINKRKEDMEILQYHDESQD